MVWASLSVTNVFEPQTTLGIEDSHQNEERRIGREQGKGKSPPFAKDREGWGLRTERKVKDNAAKTF